MNISSKVILMGALVLFMTPIFAYTPPIGIPDPGNEWGSLHPIEAVAPARPSNWTSEIAGYYYVNPTDSNATDSGNTYGYPAKPRMTVPSLSAGSYVELHGTFNDKIDVTASCTEQNPCWVRGQSQSNMPTIPASISIVDSSYLFVENLDFNGGTAVAISVTGSSHNVSVRSNRLINRAQPAGASSGISLIPGHSSTVQNIVVYDNHIESLGDWTVQEDLDFHGVGPSMWGRDSTAELKNIWILENYCTLLSGDCVQINAGNWQDSYKYLHHIYVGKNVSHKNRQTGVGVKQASDVIISQNISSGSYGNAGNAGGGIMYQYPKHRLWIIFNEIYDCVYGVRQSDTAETSEGYSDIYIIGNLIYDIHPAELSGYDASNPWEEGTAIALWHGNSTRHIIDNTIYNVYDGVNGIYSGGIEMKGNIISHIDDHSDNHFFDISHPARNDLVDMDDNLFIDDVGQSYFAWWDGVNATNSIDVVKSSGNCLNCDYVQDADGSSVFVNPSSTPSIRNFKLLPNASSLQSSVKNSAYDTFQSLYGMNIYVDFEGNPRPENNPSLGAFEFSTNVSFPPSPPTLLD